MQVGSVGSQQALAEVLVRELLVSISLTGQPAMWYKDCNGDGIMLCNQTDRANASSMQITPLPGFHAAQTLHRMLRNDNVAKNFFFPSTSPCIA